MPKLISKTIAIDGMTCVNCENRIENKLKKTKGIIYAKVSYSKATATFTFDADIISLETIESIIEELDYQVKKPADATKVKSSEKKSKINQVLGIAIIILALFTAINYFGGFNIFNAFPQAEQGMGYGMLFVIGLLTSIHCVAMCGGINLSQCVPHAAGKSEGGKFANLKPSILYNAGRVISYTIVGGIVGGLGSVVSFSGTMKGIVAILAGIFMVIMGLNMLNLFPWLRKFNPRMPKIFARKINDQKKENGKSPLIVGLLNGLMPCGPLQAMQLYALSTGSPLKGALSMLLFSLGTVPLMFGLGALSSLLSKKFTHKMMQVSAVLVIVLGVFMFQNGMSVSGMVIPNLFAASGNLSNSAVAQVKDGVQTVTTTLSSGSYEPITVQAGIPVKWTVKAAAGTVNGCNNQIIIPAYNVQKKLAVGDNVIEFTPTAAGTIPYSCWMGMIRSQINVVDDVSNTAAVNNTVQSNQSNTANGGGCCGGGATGPSTTAQQNIQLAQIINGQQQATVTVDGYGYSPQTLVIQRGVETVLKFDVKQANGCNGKIYIPEFNIQMDLTQTGETPPFVADEDFTMSCWMGMIGMNVKVVDDLTTVDLAAIQSEVQNAPKTGGGGCCGPQ